MTDSSEPVEQRKNDGKKDRPECYSRDELLANHAWAPIPLAISRSAKLSFGAKALYGEFMSWAYRSSGICRPPQIVVAWHLNVTVRHMRRFQDELEEKGAIVVIRRKNAKNSNKPNKILFVKNLRPLCPRERLSNKASVYREAIRVERETDPGAQ